ncbi:PrsW family intramembrane metalloprotease [Spirulina subsalsa FACHB-351]|uniref:PrsW family intramembrane metalloprotease n=1 Tax=Spirulina subsalsa FACHB-351 TaxID=234711 RepID=A0ABT3L2B4_9CYAN|nr:PrsW family glutamic-type intramembrane protease [Spirulina subsalsa]MCW6035658.1 PrsW family intramembrane metalloprotease [Spirulina subsalsa FACHB-351]
MQAILRQVSGHSPFTAYPLTPAQEVVLGRDPTCQIILDSDFYIGVSRRHFALRYVNNHWEVHDLGSANGTYLNGKRLKSAAILQPGDRISLAKDLVEFVFELPPPPPPEILTLSQLFPIFSTAKDLPHKAYLLPAILTISCVVLMFLTIGYPIAFNLLLSTYLAGIAFYYIYQLCGKPKPGWVLLSSSLITILLIISPALKLFSFVFRVVLPGSIPPDPTSIPPLDLFVRMFFGAGLMEELLKAVPIFLALWLGQRLKAPWNHRVGIIEPLDGILLGTSSAIGFTLIETLGQYIPDLMQSTTLQAGEAAGQLLSLQLLIPRILGLIAGHVAYSGYFGYSIGLSVLKPSKRASILLTGYLTASILHTLWNTAGFFSPFLLAVVGTLSYAFLAAAILKARQLSPTRQYNFATRLSED